MQILIWRKTKNLMFVFGLFIIYYWSLYGSWFIIADRVGMDSGAHYHYLETKMFRVYLDDNYILTMSYYFIFIFITQFIILIFSKKFPKKIHYNTKLYFSHWAVYIIAVLAVFFSVLLIEDALKYAIATEQSAYVVTRNAEEAGPFFVIHQEMNRFAVFSLAIGIAIYFSNPDSRIFVCEKNRLYLYIYLLLGLIVFGYCSILGNKNELFVGAFAGIFVYHYNAKVRHGAKIALALMVSFLFIITVDVVRSLSIDELVEDTSVNSLFTGVVKATLSNEAFGAHFSMYGVLEYKVPLTFGSSFSSLCASVVPRFFWPDRPRDIYWYYADGLSLTEGQGYTIHHATGWYLNFGVLGIIAGALVLGFIWVFFHNNFSVFVYKKTTFYRILFFLAPATFTASMPNLIRGGPENYKGVFIESILIPTFILLLAGLNRKKIENCKLFEEHDEG
jgi:hypothetical protein